MSKQVKELSEEIVGFLFDDYPDSSMNRGEATEHIADTISLHLSAPKLAGWQSATQSPWVEERQRLLEALQRAQQARNMLLRERNGEVWIWQNDEDDHPESLACPVLIQPDDLRALITAPPSPVTEEKDAEIDDLNRVRELLKGYGFSFAPGLAVTDNLAIAIARLIGEARDAAVPAVEAEPPSNTRDVSACSLHGIVDTSHRCRDYDGEPLAMALHRIKDICSAAVRAQGADAVWEEAIRIVAPWTDAYKSCREHFDDPCCHVRLATTITEALTVARAQSKGEKP